jgi:hypothetical protein
MLVVMDATSLERSTEKPRAVRIGLWLALGLLTLGAAYLYSVRGIAILFDLSSGIASMLCL